MATIPEYTEINHENPTVVLTMWSSDNGLNLRINKQCTLYFKSSLSLLTTITYAYCTSTVHEQLYGDKITEGHVGSNGKGDKYV